ncbi:WXG100 family type VII secretion target [Micromonospora sp. NPDC003197]
MEIRYNFPALQMAADNCAGASKNLNGELEGLKQGIQPLLASWEGEAQAEYYRRQNDWEAAANDLRSLLDRIEKALRESAIKMQQRESANKAKFQ